MKTNTNALTALADHLEALTKNARSHGGHGWTYDEEITMLRTASEEMKELRAALKQSRDANCCCSYGALQVDAVERANRILGYTVAAPSNAEMSHEHSANKI